MAKKETWKRFGPCFDCGRWIQSKYPTVIESIMRFGNNETHHKVQGISTVVYLSRHGCLRSAIVTVTPEGESFTRLFGDAIPSSYKLRMSYRGAMRAARRWLRKAT